jgi:hypothetical protein
MDPRQQIIVTKRYCGGSVTCFVFMEENQILMTGGGIIFKLDISKAFNCVLDLRALDSKDGLWLIWCDNKWAISFFNTNSPQWCPEGLYFIGGGFVRVISYHSCYSFLL